MLRSQGSGGDLTGLKELLANLNLNTEHPTLERIATIDRYLDNAPRETSDTDFPAVAARKVGPSNSLIMILAALVGGFSGVVFLLVRQAYRTRKRQLASLQP